MKSFLVAKNYPETGLQDTSIASLKTHSPYLGQVGLHQQQRKNELTWSTETRASVC